jgi:5-methylcytosine-specific restriction endonuclease McrA
MKKRKLKPITPRSRVRSALRQVWMRSRERALALKLAGYSCQKCGVKQSKAKGKEQKVEVHHINGISVWGKIIDLIYKELLVSPNNLEVLCKECHEEKHKKE